MRRPCPASLAPSRARVVLLAVVATAGPLVARPLAAQPVPQAPAGARPVAPVADVPRGLRVRVLTQSRAYEGWAVGTAGDTLLVRVRPDSLVRAPAAAIDGLWVRDRRGTVRGAKIGAAVGGVALGGFALFLSRALCDSSSCDGGAELALLGAGVGAAGGAVAGGLIGSLVPVWRRLHP